MKQGWEIKKIKDIASLITDGDWIESRHQSEDGIRLIQTGNVGNGVFKAKDDKPHYISEDTFNELGCTEIFAGDCLVSRLPEPVGRACIIPEISHRMITAVDCSIIRFKDVYLSKLFVYYTMSLSYQKDINNNTTGTTRKRISRKNLEQIPIPIPPFPEQERIVTELDLISGIIEKKKQQLKELDSLAQSLFYEMFGNPVENEKGWDVKKLGEVSHIINGFAFPSSEFSESNPIKAIKITNVGVNEFVDDDSSLPNQYDCKEDYKVHTGDIVIALTRTIISSGVKRALVPKEYNNALVNQRVAAIITDTKIVDKKYVYSFLGTGFVKDYVLTHATALMQPNLSIKDLRELPLIYPPLSLQQEFASKIEKIDKQKELIKQSLKDTETLFDSRMDYYFN